MVRKRRTFTTEFKLEAAQLVTEQGYSIPQASRSLGIGETALRRWVNQLQQETQGITPKSKALTAEQQRIKELEARIDRLEREKSILKKATVDSIDQRNTHMKIWVSGGSSNETSIYSIRKRVHF